MRHDMRGRYKNSNIRTEREEELVQDGPKLLDDGGEIPKSQGRGWRFETWLWNLLSTWQKNLSGGQLPPVLWRWHVDLLSPKIKKKTQERITNLSSDDFLTIRFESTFSRFRCFIFRTHLLRDFVNGQITNVITKWSSRGCMTIWLSIGTGPRKYIVRITPSLSSILGVQILQCCSLAN